MDELDATELPTVGERLRAAREEKGLSLEDVAAQTRIPRRHLESLEQADWDNLPAPTYTMGFAKSYASAVNLDRTEVGEQLRTEMGGTGAPATATEVFEPADPARTMPRWLVLAAVAAVILVVAVMSWLSNRSLDQGNDTDAPAATAPAGEAPAQTPAAQPAAPQGPVVLSATEPVWLSIKDAGTVLKQGILQPGETFPVPATATAPTLTTAKAEGLRITVGSAVAPQIGPPATKLSKVSLLPADLMKTAQATPSAAPTAAPPAPAQLRPPPVRARRAAPPAARRVTPPPAEPAPAPAPQADTATTNAGQ
ncbi:cytoskeleton protein RodZ [Sphingomonas sp. F9_3S_D5_B_2]